MFLIMVSTILKVEVGIHNGSVLAFSKPNRLRLNLFGEVQTWTELNLELVTNIVFA